MFQSFLIETKQKHGSLPLFISAVTRNVPANFSSRQASCLADFVPSHCLPFAITGLLLMAGCGGTSNPTITDKPSTQNSATELLTTSRNNVVTKRELASSDSAISSKDRLLREVPVPALSGVLNSNSNNVEWDPSSLNAGFFLKTKRDFEGYVRDSEIAAHGILTDWNGIKGTVRIEDVFNGTLNEKTVKFVRTGGMVEATTGDRVLVLLSTRDGELKLHSRCTVSGLFPYSEEMGRVVVNAFKVKR